MLVYCVSTCHQIQWGGLSQDITSVHFVIKLQNMVDVLVDMFQTNIDIGPSQNRPLVGIAVLSLLLHYKKAFPPL